MAHAKKQRRKENQNPVVVRQSLKLIVRDVVTREAVGFAVGG